MYHAVPDNGILQSEIMNIVPYAKVGFQKALVAGWIKLDKTTGKPTVHKIVSSIEDTTQKHLQNINDLADDVKLGYKKRKLLHEM